MDVTTILVMLTSPIAFLLAVWWRTRERERQASLTRQRLALQRLDRGLCLACGAAVEGERERCAACGAERTMTVEAFASSDSQ